MKIIKIGVAVGVAFIAFAGMWYTISPVSFKSSAQKVPLYASLSGAQGSVQKMNDPFREVRERGAAKEPARSSITVDAAVSKGPLQHFWSGAGHDLFYENFSYIGARYLYLHLAKENKKGRFVKYWRSHNIFSDKDAPWQKDSGTQVYRLGEDGKPTYNWKKIDQVFDFILAAGMTPIVEYGFMPELLTSDPKRIGDWGAANVAPPKDYTLWRQLVEATTRHLRERYGKQVRSWYFEVWNEPDLYYHFWRESAPGSNKTDIAEYLKLYDYTVAGIEDADPELKIGGPAIAGDLGVMEAFLKHVDTGKNYVTGSVGSRLDFISFHKYGNINEHVLPGTKNVIDKVLQVNRKRFGKLPVIVSEYGPTTTSKANWKNEPYSAAWVAGTITGLLWLSDKYGPSYLPTGMVFWSAIGENFKGGSGMLGSHIIDGKLETFARGPVLQVFDMLSHLGNERLQINGSKYGSPVHALATRGENGEYAVLLYRLRGRNSKGLKPVTIDLKLSEIRPGTYRRVEYTIDEKRNNPFAYLVKKGGPKNLGEEGFAMFEKLNKLLPDGPSEKLVLKDTFSAEISLSVNSVCLVLLTPEK